MTDPTPEGLGLRFEATVHADDLDLRANLAQTVAALDMDRMPGPSEEIRMLVNFDDCVRLLEQGLEVRLRAAVPVQPLDPELIMSDEDAQAWIEARIPPSGTEAG